MPRNVATGKGRWTALTKQDMKHLHSHNVYTKKEFYNHLSRMYDYNHCDLCWQIEFKLREYTETKSFISLQTYYKHHHPTDDSQPLHLKTSGNRHTRNDWTLFAQLLSRAKMTSSIIETAKWTWSTKCPECERNLLVFIISFNSQERYVFDVCNPCKYAYQYQVSNPKNKGDLSTPVNTSPESFQHTLF